MGELVSLARDAFDAILLTVETDERLEFAQTVTQLTQTVP